MQVAAPSTNVKVNTDLTARTGGAKVSTELGRGGGERNFNKRNLDFKDADIDDLCEGLGVGELGHSLVRVDKKPRRHDHMEVEDEGEPEEPLGTEFLLCAPNYSNQPMGNATHSDLGFQSRSSGSSVSLLSGPQHYSTELATFGRDGVVQVREVGVFNHERLAEQAYVAKRRHKEFNPREASNAAGKRYYFKRWVTVTQQYKDRDGNMMKKIAKIMELSSSFSSELCRSQCGISFKKTNQYSSSSATILTNARVNRTDLHALNRLRPCFSKLRKQSIIIRTLEDLFGRAIASARMRRTSG